MSTLTPTPLSSAQRHYRQFKAQYPEYVLFFRIGDFYELFWDDAQLAGTILQIPLTTRNPGTPEAVPMAGIPFHGLEAYLRAMIQAGHRCAVCEMTSPADWRREITRMVSPTGNDGIPQEQSAHAVPISESQPSPTPPRPRRSLIADVDRELRDQGIPCVAISDAKKALFSHAQLKAFHFVVYDKQDDNWLLWCGEPTVAVRREMANWAQVFGNDFQVVYAVRRTRGIVYKNSSGTRLMLNGEATPTPTSLFPVDSREPA